MDVQGLWKLFLATGLPEAYLLICILEQQGQEKEPAARTAFRPMWEQVGEV